MNNKREAFTMIELIFVVVVIGILASVAIPKLAASKDDAVVESCLAEFTQYAKEVQAAYMDAKDINDWKTRKVSEITNIRIGKKNSLKNGLVAYKQTTAHGKWTFYICAGEHVGWIVPRFKPNTTPATYELIIAARPKEDMTSPIQKKFYDKIIERYGGRVKRINM
jgi:prepilin-type N-terminal cleavage/methylation domain-containing protein